MAEILSALDGHVIAGRRGAVTEAPGVILSERQGLITVQLTAWPDTAAGVAAKAGEIAGTPMPPSMRLGITGAGGKPTVLQVGPERWWFLVSPTSDLGKRLQDGFPADQAVVTDLSHARTIVTITGPKGRDLLARILPIDTDPVVLPAGSVAQSVVHGVGVLLHFFATGADGDIYDLHIPRSFALSHWEWLVHVAEGLGVEVRG